MNRCLCVIAIYAWCMLQPAALTAQEVAGYEFQHNGIKYNLIDQGILHPDSEWKFPLGSHEKIIYVCWENPSPELKGKMKIVRDAVEASWQAASTLRFRGWGKCKENSPGIHILIDDSGPKVQEFGRKLNGMRNGMVLNFTFGQWLPACQKGDKDVWLAEIAVHEFGHAIGFRHEQDRDDTPAYCKPLATAPDPGTKPLTPWDAKSKMNYCYCAGDADLSDFDKIAVAKVYGEAQ